MSENVVVPLFEKFSVDCHTLEIDEKDRPVMEAEINKLIADVNITNLLKSELIAVVPAGSNISINLKNIIFVFIEKSPNFARDKLG